MLDRHDHADLAVRELLEELQRDWTRDHFGIWQRRLEEPERIIRIAGRLWKVTRDGSATELPPMPGRPMATIMLTVIEQGDEASAVKIYRVASRRRLRRRGRPRHHRVAPRTFVTKRDDDPDRLLTVRQVADALGVHPDTIRKWLEAGAISATRVGPSGTARRRVRVRAAELRRLTD